ncbi:MAG TPA: FAD-dependent oxidoreductase [Acidobacteriaceae bacterium]|nr:FAD-dependent oxidoreductase [Acidobacteriaceae bacterium]
MSPARTFDVVLAGAGVIGLSLALELRQRGLSVAVLERGRAMQAASWAAGGMLAAMDPENPPALQPLSLHSIRLYPEYLTRIQQLSGHAVPLRTHRTLQQLHAASSASTPGSLSGNRAQLTEIQLAEIRQFIPGIHLPDAPGNQHEFREIKSTSDFLEPASVFLDPAFAFLKEDSLDPRDLCRALPLAAHACGVTLIEETTVLGVSPLGDALSIQTNHPGPIHTGMFVNCCGAWSSMLPAQLPVTLPSNPFPVTPAKGQMVNLSLPAERLRCVLRVPGLYLIPRGDGRVAIGATVEYAGFDPQVHEESIQGLIDDAATLLPELRHAPRLESWVGFRPATPDGLPILGATETPHCWLATGHFRNGIMLAPVTARCMAQAMLGEPTDIALDIFSAARFATAESTLTSV